jgi:hypothetical protein
MGKKGLSMGVEEIVRWASATEELIQSPHFPLL